MITANEDNYKEILKSDKLVVLDFNASWCVPCCNMMKVLLIIEKDYEEKVDFISCDIEECGESLIEMFKIKHVPTIVFIRDGVVVDFLTYSVTRDVLEAKLKNLL